MLFQSDSCSALVNAGVSVVEDPASVWHALADPAMTAWSNGEYGRAGGLATESIAELFIGAKGTTKLAKLSTAANTGDDLVDVWRVVGPDEAADIARTGGYRVPPGGEGKYFFPTRGQAENLGQMYNKANWPGPQTLTRGQVPSSVIARAESVNAGTEGPGWFIRSPDIPSICNVQCLGTIP